MTDQVVDKDGVAADAEGLVHKASQLRRLQVMREQAATHQIEAVVMKWNCEGIGNDGAVFGLQVSAEAIEIGDIERDAFGCQLCGGRTRDISESGSDFEQGKMFLACGGCNVFNQASCGGHAAEPAVDAAEIAQRFVRLGGRTRGRVENFL